MPKPASLESWLASSKPNIVIVFTLVAYRKTIGPRAIDDVRALDEITVEGKAKRYIKQLCWKELISHFVNSGPSLIITEDSRRPSRHLNLYTGHHRRYG